MPLLSARGSRTCTSECNQRSSLASTIRPANQRNAWRSLAAQKCPQSRFRGSKALIVTAYGKAPGSGMDKVRQIIAQETASEGKGGFGPPPPEGRPNGRGFVNLSFRDTDLTDGYEEASKGSADDQNDPEEPAINLNALAGVSKDVGANPGSSADGKQRRSIWDSEYTSETVQVRSDRRFAMLMGVMLLTGVLRRLWSFSQQVNTAE